MRHSFPLRVQNLGAQVTKEADSVPNTINLNYSFFKCHFQLCVNDMNKQVQ